MVVFLLSLFGCAEGGIGQDAFGAVLDSGVDARPSRDTSLEPKDAVADAADATSEDVVVAECGRDEDCSDGDVCNGLETCQAGVCVAGTALSCDDGIECTVDSCVPSEGCVHAPDDSKCIDGTCIVDGVVDGCQSSCNAFPCDITTQCGCGGNEACYPNSATTNQCLPEGSLQEGARCNGMGACEAGVVCTALSGSSGICRSACERDADCQGPGGVCSAELGDSMINVCSLDCDPTDEFACTIDGKCTGFIDPDTDAHFTDCIPAGTGTTGSACSAQTDCAPGYICDGTSCANWCKTNADCPGLFDVCNSIITVGTVSYGICG